MCPHRAVSLFTLTSSRRFSPVVYFNTGAVKPEKTSKLCTWNFTDLDILINKFPKNYRAWVYRGLYYKFSTTYPFCRTVPLARFGQ